MSELVTCFRKKYVLWNFCFGFMYLCTCVTVLQNTMYFLLWIMVKKQSVTAFVLGGQKHSSLSQCNFSDWILTHVFSLVLLSGEQWIWLILTVFQNNLCPWKACTVCSRKSRNTLQYGRFNMKQNLIGVQSREQWVLLGEFPKKCVHS